MEHIPIVSSWSGGKDSCLALYKALSQGYRVNCLLNFISKESKRGCFHGIDSALMKLQAESIGIPLIQKEVTADMKEYELEFKTAVTELKAQGIKGMVFGDIYLLDHQSWVERVCGDLAIKAIEPLWNIPAESILDEFINLGFKSVIVSAKADCLDQSFVGRLIDKNIIPEFKKRNVCPCGENGEFHTLVIDGPLFKKRIEIQESAPLLKEGFWKHWFLDIKKYRLVDKH